MSNRKTHLENKSYYGGIYIHLMHKKNSANKSKQPQANREETAEESAEKVLRKSAKTP